MSIHEPQQALQTMRQRHHPKCMVCGLGTDGGLGIGYRVAEDGSVWAVIPGRARWQGYTGCLHGGLIATVLDGAMTHCLFAQGRTAMTGDLRVRFVRPVATGREAKVRAWVRTSAAPVHELAAELIQDDQVAARARALFRECGPATTELGADAAGPAAGTGAAEGACLHPEAQQR